MDEVHLLGLLMHLCVSLYKVILNASSNFQKLVWRHTLNLSFLYCCCVWASPCVFTYEAQLTWVFMLYIVYLKCLYLSNLLPGECSLWDVSCSRGDGIPKSGADKWGGPKTYTRANSEEEFEANSFLLHLGGAEKHNPGILHFWRGWGHVTLIFLEFSHKHSENCSMSLHLSSHDYIPGPCSYIYPLFIF